MAPMQVRIRNAIGLLKDRTSISIAKVASAGTPDLEVAIVKATSHEEVPSEERYIQVVLHLTSFSRAHVNACVCNIARRLSKTRNWVVAIKALFLAHRLLRDGNAAFEMELMLSRRQGMRVLNVSDFRDESHAHSLDFSSFVHAYSLYLDNRLDCSSFGSFGVRQKPERRPSLKASKYDYSDSMHHNDGDDPPYMTAEMKQFEKENSRSFKEMKLSELIETLPAFQRLLERVVACRPTGPARLNQLVNVALYGVIRESFVLYADLRDGLAILHDTFFDMELQDCGRVLAIYIRAAKQMDELIAFYSFCKALGVCKTVDYPSVETISGDLLDEMENFLRDAGHGNRKRRGSIDSGHHSAEQESKAGSDDTKGSSPVHVEEPPPPAPESNDTYTPSYPASNGNPMFVDIQQPTMSSEQLGDKLAVALFSGTQTNVEEKWEPFPEQGTVGSTVTGANGGVTSWELALIESESELAKPSGTSLAGGFDHLLLESLYEQGADQQNMLAATAAAGSASSVAFAGDTQLNFLALPAPPIAPKAFSNDPFAASESVPRPTYVQMSEMQHKQQLLVQEQQEWLQYQQGGVQGYIGLMKYSTNPFASPFQPAPYPVSYQSTNPYYV